MRGKIGEPFRYHSQRSIYCLGNIFLFFVSWTNNGFAGKMSKNVNVSRREKYGGQQFCSKVIDKAAHLSS